MLAQSLPICKLCSAAAAAATVAARPILVMLRPSACGSRERNLKLRVLTAELRRGGNGKANVPLGWCFSIPHHFCPESPLWDSWDLVLDQEPEKEPEPGRYCSLCSKMGACGKGPGSAILPLTLFKAVQLVTGSVM